MSNRKSQKAAKAITPTSTITLITMQLLSDGDHDSAVLAEVVTKGFEQCPRVRDEIYNGTNPLVSDDGQPNKNGQTIAQRAGRGVEEMGISTKDDKYIFHARCGTEGGSFIVERRRRVKRGQALETEVSKVYREIEYRVCDDGSWRFLTIADCPFTDALKEAMTVITGNDFKVKIADPIRERFGGFTFGSKGCYALPSVDADLFEELVTFCDLFLNTTIPSFQVSHIKLLAGSESASELSKIGHAQKGIVSELRSMITDAERQVAALQSKPTEHREKKAKSAIMHASAALTNFAQVLELKSTLNIASVESLREELNNLMADVSRVESIQSRPSNRKPSQKKALQTMVSAQKTVIENQDSKISDLEAMIAKLQAELNSKK